MLFTIDDAIASQTFGRENYERALESLFLAAKNGYHFLVLDNLMIDKLKSQFSSNRFLNAELDRLRRKAPVKKILIDTMTVHVVIVPGNEIVKSGKRIEVGIDQLILNEKILRETIFIAEGNDDIEYFNLLAEHICKKLNIPRNLNFDDRPGGGQTTEKALKRIPKDRLLFAIVDSDIRFAGCGIGDVAKSCLDSVKNHSLKHCLVLDVRNIENLLLFRPLERISARQVALDFKKICETVGDDFLRFIHVKEGIVCNKISAHYSQSGETSIRPALENHACSGKECKVIFLQGISILSNTIAFLKKHPSLALEFFESSEFYSHQEDIAKELISWTFASNKHVG